MAIIVVTGTGTDVGKTVVTAALASCADARVAVVKPAQTGVGPGQAGDLAQVTRLSGCRDVHEFARFPDPLSPHHAAATSGLPALRFPDACERVAALEQSRDTVLVEGAGGLLVPFDRTGWTLLDLAAALRAGLVVVTRAGLGTLNETALTLAAAAARGVPVLGVVIGSWPHRPGLAERCNVEDLAAMGPGGELAGALPEQMSTVADFAERARAALSPRLGGIFDWPSFRMTVRPPDPVAGYQPDRGE